MDIFVGLSLLLLSFTMSLNNIKMKVAKFVQSVSWNQETSVILWMGFSTHVLRLDVLDKAIKILTVQFPKEP